MTFSARTSANQTQDIIDAKMDKRRKVGSCCKRSFFLPPRLVVLTQSKNTPVQLSSSLVYR